MSDLNVPDGMALICKVCRWRPDSGLPMGIVAAHFETEHDSTDVRLELVVLCLRCDEVMDFVRSQPRASGAWDVFECKPCHRGRTIRRTAA